MTDNLNFQLVSFYDVKEEELNTISHNSWEHFQILIFENGNGKLLIDFKEYTIAHTIAFFINPKSVRSIAIRSFSRCWLFTIDLNYLGLLSDNYQMLFCLFTTLPFSSLSQHDYTDLNTTLTNIQKEVSGTGTKKKEAIDLLIRLLFIQIERLRTVEDSSSTLTNPLTLFYSLLEKDFIVDKDVASYASKLNITAKQLNRLCLKYLNKNAGTLIEERVNLQAMRLLYHSDLSVKEVAFRLGFKDHSYFNRYFKRINKTTPKNFKDIMS